MQIDVYIQAVAVYITFFSCIAMTKDQIGYERLVGNESLVTQKITAKAMVGFIIEGFAVYVNAAKMVAK